MTYVGRGVDAISNVEKLDNITFNGGTTYALTKSSAAFTPVGANNILISIDGVIQQGNFSVSTTNIVFDFSPTSSNTCNFVLHYGVGVLNVPADDSVSAAKISSNAVTTAKINADAVTGAKIADDQINSEHYVDGSIDTAHLGNLQVTTAKIAADAIDGTKLADDAVNSEHYTDGSIDLAHMSSESVDEDNLHISNAGSNGNFLQKQSGNTGGLTWAAATGDDNLPAFFTKMGSDQSISDATWTKIEMDSEVWDSNSTYDPSTNYRWTPGVGGQYFIFAQLHMKSNANDELNDMNIGIYKNGTRTWTYRHHFGTNYSNQASINISIIDTANTTDYYEIYGFLNDTSGDGTVDNYESSANISFFGGYRIAGT